MDVFRSLLPTTARLVVLLLSLHSLQGFADESAPWLGGVSAQCGAQNIVQVGAQPWALSTPTPTPTPTATATPTPRPPSKRNSIAGEIKSPTGAPIANAVVVVPGVGVAITDATGFFEIPNAVEGQQYTAIVTLNDAPILTAPITLTGGVSSIVQAPVQNSNPAPADCETQSIVDRITRIAELAMMMRDRVLTDLGTLSETAEISSGVSTLSMRARVVEQANNVLFVLTRLPTVERQCSEAAQQCTTRKLRFEKRSLALALRALRTELNLVNRVLAQRGLRTREQWSQSRAWAIRRAKRALENVESLPDNSDICS